MRKFINAVNGNPEAKKELDNWGLSFADNTIDVRLLILKYFLEAYCLILFVKEQHYL